MSTITIRDLDSDVQHRLKRRAAEHQRSMEAEAREILRAAVTPAGLMTFWLGETAELRGDDLPIPERSQPRDIEIG